MAECLQNPAILFKYGEVGEGNSEQSDVLFHLFWVALNCFKFYFFLFHLVLLQSEIKRSFS